MLLPAIRAEQVMRRTGILRSMLQDIKHEVVAVDTQCQGIMNQIIETRVLAAVGADTTFLGHDISAEGDGISCVF
ncbi:hypothetical protein AFLA_002579 [Aspergillus flavus NRRL3357]|nr:hypothetical protein AFLA_002579 [Aspergillus flavus NRRL3357]